MSIRVTDLEKRHPGGAPALRGVSLSVGEGRVASILGKSGAGKTTLLRCLVGLDPFDSGSIEIAGAIIAAGTRHDGAASGPKPRAAIGGAGTAALRGKVGLVFQSFELFPHLTVLDNITLAPTRVRGLARAAAEKRALELLAELGLADKARAHPESLSGGQKQRVAIARALAMEPRVLLYDEPTSALDPSLKQEVSRTIRRVASTGITQIVVTHDIDVAREASDVVFVLEAGKVARSGEPAEVLSTGSAA
jgi:ABC-type polar amino acid transport system ATPase subunit